MSNSKLVDPSLEDGNGIVSETHNCFGCSPKNDRGLKLKFEISGDTIYAPVQVGKVYESFPGVVHGGIIATILDEIMAQVAFRLEHHPSMTIGLRIRYLQPMQVNKKYIALAEISSRKGQTVEVEGKLHSAEEGDYVAFAKGTFFMLSPEHLLSDKIRLPNETLQSFSNFVSNSKV